MPSNPLTYNKVYTHEGPHYRAVLADIHRWMVPKNYFEIGVSTGLTLALATCPSIGVDPAFRISVDVVKNKKIINLFQMTSDEFFHAYDAKTILGGQVDLAFLDGLHHAEVLLRDFINIEKHSRAESLIILHDCVPTDVCMARRHEIDEEIMKLTPTPTAWAGDVWKTLVVLMKYRPDLKIVVLNAPPTGLVLIANLNPNSTVLDSKKEEINGEMAEYPINDECLVKFISQLDIKNITGTNLIEYLSAIISPREA